MYPEAVHRYATQRGLPVQEAAQTFLQIVVLRHITLPEAVFMGGTALVLGYGNPRFSEDVDLTHIRNPQQLRPGLVKAASEIAAWFGQKAVLTPPKAPASTWRLTLPMDRATTLRLHVDSQPYRAYTQRPLVLEFPSIPPFVCNTLDVDEIMAEKVIALAYRRYLGGRDLFDLWFHWLRQSDWVARQNMIAGLGRKKLRERRLKIGELLKLLDSRLAGMSDLKRARDEWRRYLPPQFHRDEIFADILSRCRHLPEIFT